MYRRPTRLRSVRGWAAVPIILLLACGGDTSGPDDRAVRLSAAAGDAQYGAPGELLADSLVALIVDATTGRPVNDVEVRWRVASGGATLAAATSRSDGTGLARNLLRLGPGDGDVRVEADADGRTGDLAVFTARGAATPTLSSVAPDPVPAGGTVILEGTGFSTTPSDHIVLFGGRAGRVTAATATRLTVEAPACLPDRTVDVQVRLGALGSNRVSAAIDGDVPAPLGLARGAFRVLAASQLSCLSLDATPGREYLVVPINAEAGPAAGMPYEFVGMAGQPIATAQENAPGTPDPTLAWEANLRALEGRIPPGPTAAALTGQANAAAVAVDIGDRDTFRVLNRENRTDEVTAEVRAITDRAIVYVDLQAPSGGFSQAELDAFGEMFDDPIYPTDIATFGMPSDIDGNGKVVILLTPRVNALTPRGQSSFIAGYFYGCDLVERSRCSDTNRAEIFYSMVPDPTGEFSSPRSRATVLATVPGVLAHEFQHMIAFGRKGRLDLLWLSEGLAHTAEEVVGAVFAARGDLANADDFQGPNYARAASYLFSPSRTSLTDEESPGTLEMRGGAFLLLEYLRAQYGASILERLTTASQLGVENIAAQTGRAWEDVFAEFTLAAWASDAPELAGVTVDPRLDFGAFDLREKLGDGPSYPLRPIALTVSDITRTGTLPPAAAQYFRIEAGAGAISPFTLSLAGRWGGPLTGVPRLGVVRID